MQLLLLLLRRWRLQQMVLLRAYNQPSIAVTCMVLHPQPCFNAGRSVGDGCKP